MDTRPSVAREVQAVVADLAQASVTVAAHVVYAGLVLPPALLMAVDALLRPLDERSD